MHPPPSLPTPSLRSAPLLLRSAGWRLALAALLGLLLAGLWRWGLA